MKNQEPKSSDHWSTSYVRHVLKVLGIRPTALARMAGISSTTLTRPLNKENYTKGLSIESLTAIWESTGISYAPFGKAQESPRKDKRKLSEKNRISGNINVEIHHIVDDLINYDENKKGNFPSIFLPLEYVKNLTKTNPAKLKILEIRGDGMAPLINKNDLVIIDTYKKKLTAEGIFAISYGEGCYVRRVVPISKFKIMVVSDNKEYPSIEYRKNEINIFGAVIWVGKSI